MPSLLKAQADLLAQDELIAGIIESIHTVDRMFDLLPFDGIDGNALAYNREATEAGVAFVGVNADLTAAGAKTPATHTQETATLTTLVGDAEVDALQQVSQSGDGNDQTAVQIASKAKALGRQFQTSFINGDGTGNTFPGLINLVAPTQTFAAAGTQLDFGDLDILLDSVTDKDGQVDYILMHQRDLRRYRARLRALGGASIGEVVELPSGVQVPGYSGVPIFRNDFIPTNLGGGTNETAIFAGTLDDGSRQHGLAGLTASQLMGIQLVEVGESENSNNFINRLRWFCGLALFSELGLSMLTGLTDA